jgi:NAD(P)-dependent dehydrogenase (short-subunit alcohol dehydrogenase family)
MTSSTVKRATGNPMHYRVSKHGLIGLTQSLAVELGPSGIRAVAVAPTLTETPWVSQLRTAGHAAGFDKFSKRLPLGRTATADDVARVVLFAVSDLAAFVTGTVLEVDGGESCA